MHVLEVVIMHAQQGERPSLAAKSVQHQTKSCKDMRLTGSRRRPGKHRRNHEATRNQATPQDPCLSVKLQVQPADLQNLHDRPATTLEARAFWQAS